MAQSLVNFRMDKDLKQSMEETCKELGLTMTTAFTIFAKKMSREKRIPFDVSVDPFYSEQNIKYWARVAGDLILGAEVKLGWDFITSLSAYAEGTIISALAQTTISQGVVDKHPIFKRYYETNIISIKC